MADGEVLDVKHGVDATNHPSGDHYPNVESPTVESLLPSPQATPTAVGGDKQGKGYFSYSGTTLGGQQPVLRMPSA
ncbi:hypothetical protein GCM10022247_37680 [Allokutzneria multivorans]|uniref:Uncharacterized protein n=1 Tax=Allokutzneria multivorans TaxID=1142134 RepID=A0ABP7SGZ5_9PSEU